MFNVNRGQIDIHVSDVSFSPNTELITFTLQNSDYLYNDTPTNYILVSFIENFNELFQKPQTTVYYNLPNETRLINRLYLG